MKTKLTLFIAAALIITTVVAGFNNPDERNRTTNHRASIVTNYQMVVQGEPQTDFSSPLSESFEGTFPPAGWTKIQPISGTTGWSKQLHGTTPVPGFNGGFVLAPTGGGTGVAFCNYESGSNPPGGGGPLDQWLITPQITNVQPADSLTFWLRKFGTYADNIWVRISTTTPTVAGMTVVVASLPFTVADSGYIHYKYNIGSLVPPGSNIYIGFRNWVTNSAVDGASFCMDLVNVTSNVTGITHNGSEIPSKYALDQNYPNPFNPATNINFSIPTAGHVKLAVYDILGNEVKVLLNGFQNPGNYTANFNFSHLASGTYIYRLTAGDFTDTKKMVLVK